MNRIRLPIVILLCLGTIAGSWWVGTRRYDFLSPPGAAEINAIEQRTTQNLARPTDLFAIPTADNLPEPTDAATPQAENPKPQKIDATALPDPLPLDLWTDLPDHPAASFIDLASRLETQAKLSAARLAWERVIDHTKSSPDELTAAMNGIRRIRELEPSQTIHLHPHDLILHVTTPQDRLQLTKRAADEAAAILSNASEGKIAFEPQVKAADSPDTIISVDIQSTKGDQSAHITLPAPDTQKALRTHILKAAYQSISATLAIEASLRPLSLPADDEAPITSIQQRITRRAWDLFAKLFFQP